MTIHFAVRYFIVKVGTLGLRVMRPVKLLLRLVHFEGTAVHII